MGQIRHIRLDGTVTCRQDDKADGFYVRAGFEPSTADQKKRQIDIVLSDETTNTARVFDSNTFTYVDQTLSMAPENVRLGRLNNAAPFLIDHNMDSPSQIGKILEGSVRIEGNAPERKLVATVQFDAVENLSEANERHVQGIFGGIRKNVSVRFVSHETVVTEREGASDHHQVTDWEPYEGSSVTMGADDGAMTRSTNYRPANMSPVYSREASVPKTPEQIEAESIVKAENERAAKAKMEARIVEVAEARASEIVKSRLTDAETEWMVNATARKASLTQLGRALRANPETVDGWTAETLADGRSVGFESIRDREFAKAAEADDNPGGKPMGNHVTVGNGHDEHQIRGLSMVASLLTERCGRDPEKAKKALVANHKRRIGGRHSLITGMSRDVLEGVDFGRMAE